MLATTVVLSPGTTIVRISPVLGPQGVVAMACWDQYMARTWPHRSQGGIYNNGQRSTRTRAEVHANVWQCDTGVHEACMHANTAPRQARQRCLEAV